MDKLWKGLYRACKLYGCTHNRYGNALWPIVLLTKFEQLITYNISWHSSDIILSHPHHSPIWSSPHYMHLFMLQKVQGNHWGYWTPKFVRSMRSISTWTFSKWKHWTSSSSTLKQPQADESCVGATTTHRASQSCFRPSIIFSMYSGFVSVFYPPPQIADGPHGPHRSIWTPPGIQVASKWIWSEFQTIACIDSSLYKFWKMQDVMQLILTQTLFW